MYQYGKKINPHYIIAPMRGAYPFVISYRVLAERSGDNMPEVILLPLGTTFEKSTKRLRGLRKPEKRQAIKDYLGKTLKGHAEKLTNPVSILLIDEVMHGGTIITSYRLIQKYIQTHKLPYILHVCAIEDGQTTPRGKYTQFAERYNFRRIRVLSLFTMDRELYLPFLSKEEDGQFNLDITAAPGLRLIVDALGRYSSAFPNDQPEIALSRELFSPSGGQ